jgi:hypothetical protein
MIAKVSRRSTQNSRKPLKDPFAVGVLRFLRVTIVGAAKTVGTQSAQRPQQEWLMMWLMLVVSAPVWAHDFERTQVALTFARDGAFVLDVTNDAAWFSHRLVPFAERGPEPPPPAHGGPPKPREGGKTAQQRPDSFIDRVVLFVDGREVRPDSVEYVAGPAPVATYRMRGRMPTDARTLRWYYGLPIDPYPLTIRRADGRVVVEEIAGDAWSRPIDLTGQFYAPRVRAATAALAVAALLLIPIAMRLVGRRKTSHANYDNTKTQKPKHIFFVVS